MKLRRIANLKFETVEKIIFDTDIRWDGPSIDVINPVYDELLVELHPSGWLVIYPRYQWDGPSGPTVDDTTNIGPSLLHDALYEILRGVGDKFFTRQQADAAMYAELVKNVEVARSEGRIGAVKSAFLRARYATWYRGLRWFAFYAARRRALEDKYRTLEVM